MDGSLCMRFLQIKSLSGTKTAEFKEYYPFTKQQFRFWQGQ